MKPLEKFLKKQGSHLAGRAGAGPGPLQRRHSVSRLLLPGFLREPGEGEPAAGMEPGQPGGDGRWLELRPPDAALRSPSSFSSEELSPAGGEPPLSPAPAATCCWPPGPPDSPERLLGALLERLGADPASHGPGCGAGPCQLYQAGL